jgi:DNA methylase
MNPKAEAYRRFLEAKVAAAPSCGFEVSAEDVNPACKPHVRAIVPWMVRRGRAACFSRFGLQKTVTQLEAVRLTRERAGGRALIVCPLGVRQEFRRDAVERLAWSEPPRFIRSTAEADDPEGFYLTNYESVREGKIDPLAFSVASLDEAAVLRGFGGSKTFRQFMALFAGDDRSGARTPGVPYRYVATATPSPNEFIELLAYAAYLDVMDVSAAKTRFFKRDSTKADHLTLHDHKTREFWLWVASWAIFLQRPSDLGPEYSDEGYILPPLDVRWHEVATDHSGAGAEKDGQARLYKNAALGVTEASREKRDSLPARLAKLMEIRAEDPAAHRILWHDLEAEREAIELTVPGVVSVYGSQDLDAREQIVADFADGRTPELAAKPVMLGAGVNLQRHCAWAIYLGIGFKLADFLQSVHRLQRYGQGRPVRIDLIYTEAEREVRRTLEGKWHQHEVLVEQMAGIIREYGLGDASAAGLARTMGCERAEISGDGYRLVNNDAVLESIEMEADSVGLIVTSIPFAHQYEYSPSFNDFGHTDDFAHFWRQMDFLTPELLRVLQPGRVAAVHVKDRITPGGINGYGFQTVHPLSDECVAHFTSHGFAYLARKTVVTDVVRENEQTYRLGWSEQCKDGSRMGAGMPEYVLLFRKPQTDRTRGYADVPVVKSKEKYSRGRWQFDAHGYTRSNGNRPISIADLKGLSHPQVFQLFRKYSLTQVYDFERDVAIADYLDSVGMLPPSFMLLQPQSWHPDVWTDITRMRTLNMVQERKGAEMHLCPLQFDLVDRLITQFSMEGELVFDPFGGLMTVPYCAIKLRRRGLAVELAHRYFLDGAAHCAAAAHDVATPSLFDLVDADPVAEGA